MTNKNITDTNVNNTKSNFDFIDHKTTTKIIEICYIIYMSLGFYKY